MRGWAGPWASDVRWWDPLARGGGARAGRWSSTAAPTRATSRAWSWWRPAAPASKRSTTDAPWVAARCEPIVQPATGRRGCRRAARRAERDGRLGDEPGCRSTVRPARRVHEERMADVDVPGVAGCEPDPVGRLGEWCVHPEHAVVTERAEERGDLQHESRGGFGSARRRCSRPTGGTTGGGRVATIGEFTNHLPSLSKLESMCQPASPGSASLGNRTTNSPRFGRGSQTSGSRS